ncbi:MocR-like pyridoxine biosynthesis transcription factor PdxR [Acinetobacter larvae]|uniref:GntR family transcriptional regulator n=1 Tax=Acinetobacter larvae TaxID=1789224 RepID=A0A1B2M1M1_9GAMM|nr:PLP-dependent aminotransferase family protein [Acinetobacter larvae]AOA59051.1 GntR family transcriptional regulator [Acinetobacter larvae]
MKANKALFANILLQDGKIKQQLYQALKDMILTGQLAPNTQLPSSRALAEMMAISRNSVLAALERLMDEGYLLTRASSGTYVSAHIPDDLIHSQQNSISRTSTIAHSTQLNPNTAQLLALWHKNVPLNSQGQLLSIGVGCTDIFPHKLWGRLLGRSWRQFSQNSKQAQDPMGLLQLRQALADYVQTTRGVHCSAAQIMIVNGTQQAMNIAAQALLQSGDAVCLDEPGYDGALAAFQAVGATVHPIPCQSDGVDIAYAIKNHPEARLIFTAPSHQFPLGGTLSLNKRMRLLDWAAQQQAWIFEDDYNSEFRYKARPIQALQGLDQQQRVIYAGSFSKMMFPGFRLGFLIIPTALIETFLVTKYYTNTSSAYLEQATMAYFIAEGHYARHVRRVRQACYQRQQTMIQAITQYLPDDFIVEPADAGIHLLCWLPDRIDLAALLLRCQQAGLGIQPLSRYCQLKTPRSAILLGFAAHSPEQIIASIQCLARLVEKGS